MKPIDIFEHKRKWLPNAHQLNIGVDESDWALAFCKEKFSIESWDLKKYTHPDDSHTLLFEKFSDLEIFKSAYELELNRY